MAIFVGPATGAESWGKSIHWPACGAKKCFIAAAVAGDITTTVNKGRRARPMSSLLLLDVYARNILLFGKKNRDQFTLDQKKRK